MDITLWGGHHASEMSSFSLSGTLAVHRLLISVRFVRFVKGKNVPAHVRARTACGLQAGEGEKVF